MVGSENFRAPRLARGKRGCDRQRSTNTLKKNKKAEKGKCETFRKEGGAKREDDLKKEGKDTEGDTRPVQGYQVKSRAGPKLGQKKRGKHEPPRKG